MHWKGFQSRADQPGARRPRRPGEPPWPCRLVGTRKGAISRQAGAEPARPALSSTSADLSPEPLEGPADGRDRADVVDLVPGPPRPARFAPFGPTLSESRLALKGPFQPPVWSGATDPDGQRSQAIQRRRLPCAAERPRPLAVGAILWMQKSQRVRKRVCSRFANRIRGDRDTQSLRGIRVGRRIRALIDCVGLELFAVENVENR